MINWDNVYKDHDFSIKLDNTYNFIAQYSEGKQEMTGGLDNGKSYIVRVTANLQGTSSSNLQVKLRFPLELHEPHLVFALLIFTTLNLILA